MSMPSGHVKVPAGMRRLLVSGAPARRYVVLRVVTPGYVHIGGDDVDDTGYELAHGPWGIALPTGAGLYALGGTTPTVVTYLASDTPLAALS